MYPLTKKLVRGYMYILQEEQSEYFNQSNGCRKFLGMHSRKPYFMQYMLLHIGALLQEHARKIWKNLIVRSNIKGIIVNGHF